MTDVIEGMAMAMFYATRDEDVSQETYRILAQAALDYLKQSAPASDPDICYCPACMDWRAASPKCVIVRNWETQVPASKPLPSALDGQGPELTIEQIRAMQERGWIK